MELLRLRAAKLAAAAQSLKRLSGRAEAPFCLAFLTDKSRIRHPERIIRALPSGTAVIFRDYREKNREALAASLSALCAEQGLIFLVGHDIELAKKTGAQGVHFPSWADWETATPADMIRTAACHTAEDLEKAQKTGMDLAFLTPAFATGSHPDAQGLGAEAFCRLATNAALPVIALGGVDEINAHLLAAPHVVGIAAIGAFSDR